MIDFLTFNGDNVDNCIYLCENFFHVDNTSHYIQI